MYASKLYTYPRRIVFAGRQVHVTSLLQDSERLCPEHLTCYHKQDRKEKEGRSECDAPHGAAIL